jgi:nucleoside-diphosphate-sugar epimerase
MRILVTGASGFIGKALCRELLARGHAVRAAVRRLDATASTDMQQVAVPDLAGVSDWNALVAGIDAVVHLAAIVHRATNDEELRRFNVDASVALAQAAVGTVRRFVFMSSIKVHGEDSGDGAFRESEPLRPADAYGRSKREAEIALAKAADRGGMEFVAVRPPLVYGPGVGANFLRLLRWVDSGMPLPFAGISNRRSLIGLGNLVDAVARCVVHPDARGPILFCDNESPSTPEIVGRIARALDRPARLVSVPPALLRIAGTLSGHRDEIQRLTGNLAIDSAHARRVLDWTPRQTLDQGLAETATWFRRHSH